MKHRRLEALKALAERPGTPAEGDLARAMLERAGAKPSTPSTDDLIREAISHAGIATEIRIRFPRGTRVYYNQWAYSENCAGTVKGYCSKWNWARVKFDQLKQVRSVPIYSAKGWHLSTVPVDRDTLDRTGLGGFTKAERDAIRDEVNRKLRDTAPFNLSDDEISEEWKR